MVEAHCPQTIILLATDREREGERERAQRENELQQKTHNAKRLLWRLRTTTPTVWKLFPGFVSPFNFEKVLWKLYEDFAKRARNRHTSVSVCSLCLLPNTTTRATSKRDRRRRRIEVRTTIRRTIRWTFRSTSDSYHERTRTCTCVDSTVSLVRHLLSFASLRPVPFFFFFSFFFSFRRA